MAAIKEEMDVYETMEDARKHFYQGYYVEGEPETPFDEESERPDEEEFIL